MMSHRFGATAYGLSTLSDDWRSDALCRNDDPELWFPIGEDGPALLQIEQAKAICGRCRSSDACLQWAVATGQRHGIWGGLTEHERRRAIAPNVPALATHKRVKPTLTAIGLSVVAHAALGHSHAETAAALGISMQAVSANGYRARQALGAADMVEAVRIATEAGWLDTALAEVPQ